MQQTLATIYWVSFLQVSEAFQKGLQCNRMNTENELGRHQESTMMKEEDEAREYSQFIKYTLWDSVQLLEWAGILTLSFLVAKAKGNLNSYKSPMIGAHRYFKRSPRTESRREFPLRLHKGGTTQGWGPGFQQCPHSQRTPGLSHRPFSRTPLPVELGDHSRPE